MRNVTEVRSGAARAVVFVLNRSRQSDVSIGPYLTQLLVSRGYTGSSSASYLTYL